MRTPDRTPLDRGLLRDALAIGTAAAMIGISFGAISVAQGMPKWLPTAMSLLIFAGGSQFLAVGMLAAGNPVAAILGGLLVNVRHLPFGLAIGGALGDRLPLKLLGAHVLIDENTAFALAQDEEHRRRQAYWLVGGILFVTWNLGVAAGVVVGGAVGDPATYGLDAAFPAGLLALILPAMRDRTTRTSAAIGAVVAVAATPLLPAGLPVLAALLGVGAGVVRRFSLQGASE
ncbi:MAG: branched-chain amino acid ABC transporter permease [Hamadaea sp.]|nr:branched-chain amino acid ABC transporter permease [Hamadaea sp.]NUS07590.1 branched-chain amino acid ABC transporter permease [Nonomuraea sp.]NUT03083.1 branched-chain amino acid ABC transporter permease [Hamadaea sp.]